MTPNSERVDGVELETNRKLSSLRMAIAFAPVDCPNAVLRAKVGGVSGVKAPVDELIRNALI